jgi:hypothetical protein
VLRPPKEINAEAILVEAKLVRMTPGELEGYLVRLAAVTPVVRWNGVPVGVSEAARRAVDLNESTAVAAHGADVFTGS